MDKVAELESSGKLKEAFLECVRLAEQGSYEAQMNAAWKCQWGEGTERDFLAAESWYREASKSHSEIDGLTALFYLANMYRTSEKSEEAFDLMESVANKGFLPAAFRLGEMLSAGDGCTQDEELARYYREYAASRGHAWAQRNVAARMMRGQYGPRMIPIGVLRFFLALGRVVKESSVDRHSQKALV